MKVKRMRNIKDLYYNIDDFGNKSNVLLITGLSGSGKSYLAKEFEEKYNAISFQVEWLIHAKHVSEECKFILDSFLEKYPEIRELVSNKWNNCKNEDDNELLKKYINLFFLYFLEQKDQKQLYVIEGIQLFTLIDYENIKEYPMIIKGTSSFKSLKNRYLRDYKRKNITKFKEKVKFTYKVLKQSRLYQFKHRYKLNKLIENKEKSNRN